MSDENTMGGAQPEESGAQTRENEVLSGADRDYKKDMLKFKDLYQSSQERLSSLEKRLDQREIESAQSQGDKDKVIQTLQEKLTQAEKKNKTTQYTAARTNVESELKMLAKESGCVDPSLLVRLLGNDRIDKITVDSGLRPDHNEIKDLIDDSMKEFENIRLFTKSINIPDLTPNTPPKTLPQAPKSTKELSNDELKNKILSLPGEKRIADLNR